jgi:WhiB family transcriptional regulator, redox-sensing transcriptional regulator
VLHDLPVPPVDLGLDASWRARAACRFCPPELFFPGESHGIAHECSERAKEVCQACEVRGECLTFALETRQEYGIWGGTDEKERGRIRRKSRVAALVGSVSSHQLPGAMPTSCSSSLSPLLAYRDRPDVG